MWIEHLDRESEEEGGGSAVRPATGDQDRPVGCLVEGWAKEGSIRREVRAIHCSFLLCGFAQGAAFRIVFVASLSTLLTFATHKPESLRGLSKWAVNYVLKGPNSFTKKSL